MTWIPPELRENQGEIEAAEVGKLPGLVELKHIRGDLHMHTRETNGRATQEEMASAAKKLGYEEVQVHGTVIYAHSLQNKGVDTLREPLWGWAFLSRAFEG